MGSQDANRVRRKGDTASRTGGFGWLHEQALVSDPLQRAGNGERATLLDGIPVMINVGGRELRVMRVVATYTVNELGIGPVGTAWRLQLEDYRRVVVLGDTQGGWLLLAAALFAHRTARLREDDLADFGVHGVDRVITP
jgi:hypothetical protein